MLSISPTIEEQYEKSCLSAALDEIRDEIESCRKAFQQLTRRMPSEFLAYQNAQEKFWDQPDEGLPFETTTGIT